MKKRKKKKRYKIKKKKKKMHKCLLTTVGYDLSGSTIFIDLVGLHFEMQTKMFLNQLQF